MIRQIGDKIYVEENHFKTLMAIRGWGSFVEHFISVTYKYVPELMAEGLNELFCDVESIEPSVVREGIKADLQGMIKVYTKYAVGNGPQNGENNELR
jgi:hypothetical protein